MEDPCQRTTFYYDNTLDGTFSSQYTANRLTAVQYGTPVDYINTGGTCGDKQPYGFTELYSYRPAGLPDW